jgi:hypothetical protein
MRRREFVKLTVGAIVGGLGLGATPRQSFDVLCESHAMDWLDIDAIRSIDVYSAGGTQLASLRLDRYAVSRMPGGKFLVEFEARDGGSQASGIPHETRFVGKNGRTLLSTTGVGFDGVSTIGAIVTMAGSLVV